MSVEARIKEMLGQRSSLNEVASSGDSSRPRQGSSQDAKFEELGNLDNVKPNANVGKDSSKSSKAATSGDGSTRPKQGSSEDPRVEDLDNMKSLGTASSKMKKDTSLNAKVKGDASSDMQGSSQKATWTEVGEDEEYDEDSLDDSEEFDDDEEIDEESLDELSKKTLGSYINKASTETLGHGVAAGLGDKDGKIDRKSFYKAHKRSGGIKVAAKKLTKEEIESIFGTELTEEFQTKATEIFEAAVIARVNDEIIAIEESLEEAYNEALAEDLEEQKESISEKINAYLDYIVNEWLEDNQLAVENGLKLEVMESFMSGLKDLFQENYIEVPDEKVDVLEVMQSEIDGLKGKLNEEINKNIENASLINEANRLEIFDKLSKGLADTEIERFEKLIEGIEFDDEDLYAQKLAVIRKNHFMKHLEESIVLDPDTDSNIKHNNDRISRYAQAISRSVKK